MTAINLLLRRARRRMVWNIILEQASLASAVGFGGFLLLLLLGSQVLDWRLIVLVVVATFAVGVYRTLRRVPTEYRVAQALDRRMETADALSTAWHFQAPGARPAADAELIEWQRDAAERTALSLDAAVAFPVRFPRGAYVAAVACVAALTMFGIRYGVKRSLDLSRPIAEFSFDFFSGSGKPRDERTAKNKNPLAKVLDEAGNQVTEKLDPAQFEALPENAYSVDPEENPMAASVKKEAVKHNPGDDQENSAERGERSTGNSDQDPGAEAPDGNAPAQKGPNKPPKKNREEDSNLIQKMKEAMANLLDKLKITPPNNGEGETSERASKDSSPQQGGQKGQSQDGKQMPGKPQADGSQQGKAENEQPGESEEKAQGGKSSKGERGAEERASKDSRSGIGREDGDKDLRAAENQAAMGKLSEIIGKRAEKLTGEMMVEVNSSKQQALKTQYSNTGAKHAESGGEIHRDEVPLEHQQYVKQYFEQVRKAAAKSAATTGAKQ